MTFESVEWIFSNHAVEQVRNSASFNSYCYNRESSATHL